MNGNLPAVKTCTKCDVTKPREDFSKDLRKSDGLNSWCKACMKSAQQAWAATPEGQAKRRASHRRYTKTSKGKASDRNTQLRRKYGITQVDYESMLAAQFGCCATCYTDKPGRKDRHFHVDHDHTTGKVRGLLCTSTPDRCLTTV